MPAWSKGLPGSTKPVVAMAHLPALPGTPGGDENRGIDALIERLESNALVSGPMSATAG